MGLRINTNVASLTAQRNLSKATNALSRNFQRLATGDRTAVPGDDPAGRAISQRLTARVRSLDQASRNAQDGVSVLQTAAGSLTEISSVLVRAKELSVQASNPIYGATDVAALDAEFQEIIAEVDRIAAAANFNGVQLLDGSSATLDFQIGIASGDTLTVSLPDVTATTLAIGTLDLTSTGNAQTASDAIETAIDTLSGAQGQLGAAYNRLETVVSDLEQQSENTAAAASRLKDVDIAKESAELTLNSIKQQAAISILSQANVQPQAALNLLQG